VKLLLAKTGSYDQTSHVFLEKCTVRTVRMATEEERATRESQVPVVITSRTVETGAGLVLCIIDRKREPPVHG